MSMSFDSSIASPPKPAPTDHDNAIEAGHESSGRDSDSLRPADRAATAAPDLNQPWFPDTTESGTECQHFVNRRNRDRVSQEGLERRQFASNYSDLSPAGAELGKAIDSYKVANRRRYITFDEILFVLESLGYRRDDEDGLAAGPTQPVAEDECAPGMHHENL